MRLFLLVLGFGHVFCVDKNILSTEVFQIILDPALFNWTTEEPHNFFYQPSLLNAPDLPSWINYIQSDKHHFGYLYGVPPTNIAPKTSLQVVGLNKMNYETRVEQIDIRISEKLSPAKYEVHMKIDNLNVDDVFDVEKMDKLKDIFRKLLWKDSENDLYVTFLASAVELGARKPLDPNIGEGIVIRFGSRESFSMELIELQKEVKPLWKVPVCPRDFKRTSVERYFREAGLALDWCNFRLIDDNNSMMHQAGMKENPSEIDPSLKTWKGVEKSEIPIRSYAYDIFTTTIWPIIAFNGVIWTLHIVVCFFEDYLKPPLSENNPLTTKTPESHDRFASLSRNITPLRSLSMHRDLPLASSPDPLLLPLSHTNSPNSSLSRGVHCRPTPPPYVRPMVKPDF